ncbi:MAG: hypothetical protein RI897_2727 [Verrucomicrobiota bacterium]
MGGEFDRCGADRAALVARGDLESEGVGGECCVGGFELELGSWAGEAAEFDAGDRLDVPGGLVVGWGELVGEVLGELEVGVDEEGAGEDGVTREVVGEEGGGGWGHFESGVEGLVGGEGFGLGQDGGQAMEGTGLGALLADELEALADVGGVVEVFDGEHGADAIGEADDGLAVGGGEAGVDD